MPKIIIANDTLAPDPDSGKSVLFTKTDGLYVVLESGTVVGPLAGPFSMAAGGVLTGTYPNPGLANNAVTTTKIANGAVTGAKIDPTLLDPVAGTAGLRTLGTGAQQAAAGNDPRLSNSRAPSGAASGDLAGSYPAPVVARLRGGLISTTPPLVNQTLIWNGTSWTPTTVGAVSAVTSLTGDVTGTGPGAAATTIANGVVTSAKLDAAVSGVLPTAGEKLALAGTNGTPGVGNEYVTTTDSRMTNARSPSQLQFAFDAAATGASPLIIGSVYLSSGTTIGAASRAMIGGSLAGETALLELRRFTGGTPLAQFAPVAGTLQDVPLFGGVDVPVVTSDWYDLYLSETGGGTALAKGLQLVLS
jgi:hypothetical protein